ncbi:MAG TPA: DNA damage-inducible protein DinB [Chitinophagaceae bacterium]|nr:DNA damage-inducible protein DinB [Chitinophagaceae bacterium]
MIKIYKPTETVPPFYQGYINLVPDDGNLLIHLEDIISETEELIRSLPEEKTNYRYAPGKWTIRDMLVHMADTERIFVYRALRFSRGDETALPGFNEKLFAEHALANERYTEDILREFSRVREASIAFVESLSDEALNRKGTANGYPVSVRLIVNLLYGHHKHHLNILRERYL